MLDAIVEDFLRGGLEVLTPIDGRCAETFKIPSRLSRTPIRSAEELPKVLAQLADEADFVLVIAPESNNCLSDCLNWMRASESKLISPDSAFIEISQSKLATIEYLESKEFKALPRILHRDFPIAYDEAEPIQAVLKLVIGAGSEHVEFIPDLSLWRPEAFEPNEFHLEEFVAGTPVSVSVICRPEGDIFLPPTEQLFDRKPFGEYVGAGFPIDDPISQRATEITRRAVELLPSTRGYIGFDIVIGEDPAQDCLIEINPRLTTSYLKLREICPDNLAMKMLPVNVEVNG